MMDAAEMDRETLLKAYRDRVSNLESQVECLKRSRDKFRDQFTARKKHLDYLSERHNALAVKCDRLEKNQMPEGAVCFVPTGEVRCPKKGDSFKTAEGAFTTTDFDWPGMATSDDLDREIYRRHESPPTCEGRGHFVDTNKMVNELSAERDALKAEVERLTKDVEYHKWLERIMQSADRGHHNQYRRVDELFNRATKELADLRRDREAWDAVKKLRGDVICNFDCTMWKAKLFREARLRSEGNYFADPREAVLALAKELEGKG